MTMRPAIRVFAVHPWVAKDPSFLHADSKGSDQTRGMLRLIYVFAGPTCHFVGFVMRRLIYLLHWNFLHSSINKPTKWHVCPAKAEIRHLPSLLCTKPSSGGQWGLSAWLDWANTQADLSLWWGHMSFCWFCPALSHYFVGYQIRK